MGVSFIVVGSIIVVQDGTVLGIKVLVTIFLIYYWMPLED